VVSFMADRPLFEMPTRIHDKKLGTLPFGIRWRTFAFRVSTTDLRSPAYRPDGASTLHQIFQGDVIPMHVIPGTQLLDSLERIGPSRDPAP
jgi:hypothetical protein